MSGRTFHGRSGERGFTFMEALVVLGLATVLMVITIPNLQRSRVRAAMLAEVKTVRQAVAIARINAIKNQQQVVVVTDAGNSVVVGIDANEDENITGSEMVLGRWPIAEVITVTNDTTNFLRPVRYLSVNHRGLVVRPTGIVLADASNDGTGSGALLLTDARDNIVRITVTSGVGTITEAMKVGASWYPGLDYWKYYQ